MAGVINDIDALVEFRAHLLQFNKELAENFATIRSHWRELGEVWRDDMYRKFGEALEEVTPGIEHYLSATEGHEAHLAALIDRLRAYLDTGFGAGRAEGGASRAGSGTGRTAGGADRAEGARQGEPRAGRAGTREPGGGLADVTEIHADIDALKAFREALVRYRRAQRDVADRGADAIEVARSSLAAKADRWRSRLERCLAELDACRDRAADLGGGPQADRDGHAAAGADVVDCSGYVLAVAEAEQRLEHIRRWQQRVEEEAAAFHGTAGLFRDLLENDLPRTEGHLAALITSLEAARRVQAGS